MDDLVGFSQNNPTWGSAPALTTAGAMEKPELELRAELNRLLQKQAEILESRAYGAATEIDLIEYDLRQRAIQDLRIQLARLTKS